MTKPLEAFSHGIVIDRGEQASLHATISLIQPQNMTNVDYYLYRTNSSIACLSCGFRKVHDCSGISTGKDAHLTSPSAVIINELASHGAPCVRGAVKEK